MKRFLSTTAVLLALLLCIILSGCGEEALLPDQQNAASSAADSKLPQTDQQSSSGEIHPVSENSSGGTAESLDGTTWIAVSYIQADDPESISVYENMYGLIAEFSEKEVEFRDTDGMTAQLGYRISDGEIVFEGGQDSDGHEISGFTAVVADDIMELTAPTGTVFRMEHADDAKSLEYRNWMESLMKREEDSDPQAGPGFVYYENELFSTEIPEDWALSHVKIQYFADTITQPHEDRNMWCSIVVNGGGFKDGAVEELIAGYNFEYHFYEDTIAGCPAKIIERGGAELGLSQRDIYAETPDGTRFVLHFACPNYGEEFDFSEIQEIMDHFLSCIEFR